MQMPYFFPQFLERQYLDWQRREGKRKTLEDFARYLGISRPLLSMWMKGTRRPGSENIELLAETFGLEVYDALELDRPNPYLQRINQLFPKITSERQQKLAEDAERYGSENERHKAASRKRKASSN
jgi:transcriptional regulator with XRE-family HTH domain